MPRRILNIGGIANDGKGDTLRVASQKINENFQELYTGLTFSENVGNLAPALINTDSLNEGLTNLYFSNERVDDRVNALIVAGTSLTKVYDDASNTLTLNAEPAGAQLTDLSVTTGTPNGAFGGGALSYNSTNGVFTFIPAPTSSVNQATPSGGGSLSYDVGTGVFTFTPPDLSSYVTSVNLTDDLNAVVNRGSTTTSGITVGDLNGLTIPAGPGTIALTSQLAAGGGLTDIEFDLTPQLGGDLDVNGNNITGATVNIVSSNAGDINVTPDTTGNIVLHGATWPNVTGYVNGNVLTTDASGNLSWQAPAAGNTALATPSSDGLMSASDKTKLDGLSGGVTVEVDTTLPSPGTEGELFFYEGEANGDGARLYIYTNSNWIDASPNRVFTSLDARGIISKIGLDTNDYIDVQSTQQSFFLDGNEDMRLFNNGNLHVDGDVVAFSTTISDPRLKENIEPISSALEKLESLTGYTFNYKNDGQKSAGVISTEVAKVLPSAVKKSTLPLKTDDEEEYDVVQYDQLHALLIEAVKELSERVRILENGSSN